MAAVTTPEGVCNLALGLVGQAQLVDNIITETSAEARACKAHFASARNRCLQRWAWKFAVRRAVLALSTETRTGWNYAYSAPATYLQEAPCRIWAGRRDTTTGEKVAFDLELNDAGDGLLVLTDMPEAEFIFVAEVTTVALWSQLFVDAVAAELAVALAGVLPKKIQLQAGLMQEAARRLHMAAAASGNAMQLDPPPDSELITVRSTRRSRLPPGI